MRTLKKMFPPFHTRTLLVIALLIPFTSLALTFTGGVKILSNLTVVGALAKGSGSFVIDDPVDPANYLLYHSFVEAPDMMDLYDGTVTLDSSGEAVVQLPDYYDALNYDTRYQFFPIGQAMPDLYIKNEEGNNQFTIAGGVAGGQVSWQVTGIRHDPYALKYPVTDIVEKGPGQPVDKGQYIFPEYPQYEAQESQYQSQ